MPLPPPVPYVQQQIPASNPPLMIMQSNSLQPVTQTPIVEVPQQPQLPKKPTWVLVVPYTLNNKFISWSPDDEWSKIWKAPGRSHGLRFVTDMGDYDDKKNITNEDLLNPSDHIGDFIRLGNRYGASTIVIMKKNDNNIDMSIINYSGEVSQEEEMPEKNDIDTLKSFHQNLMNDVYSIITTGDDENVPEDDTSPVLSNNTIEKTQFVDIKDLPDLTNGGYYGMSLVMDATRPDIVEKIRFMSEGTVGFQTISLNIDKGGVELIGKWLGDKNSFINMLKEKGIPVGDSQ